MVELRCVHLPQGWLIDYYRISEKNHLPNLLNHTCAELICNDFSIIIIEGQKKCTTEQIMCHKNIECPPRNDVSSHNLQNGKLNRNKLETIHPWHDCTATVRQKLVYEHGSRQVKVVLVNIYITLKHAWISSLICVVCLRQHFRLRVPYVVSNMFRCFFSCFVRVFVVVACWIAQTIKYTFG